MDPKRVKRKFPGRLRAIRLRAGLTQAKLAVLAGIDPRRVSWLETGRVFPNTITTLRLALALNVSMDFLVGRRKPQAPDLEKPPKQAVQPLFIPDWGRTQDAEQPQPGLDRESVSGTP